MCFINWLNVSPIFRRSSVSAPNSLFFLSFQALNAMCRKRTRRNSDRIQRFLNMHGIKLLSHIMPNLLFRFRCHFRNLCNQNIWQHSFLLITISDYTQPIFDSLIKKHIRKSVFKRCWYQNDWEFFGIFGAHKMIGDILTVLAESTFTYIQMYTYHLATIPFCMRQ